MREGKQRLKSINKEGIQKTHNTQTRKKEQNKKERKTC